MKLFVVFLFANIACGQGNPIPQASSDECPSYCPNPHKDLFSEIQTSFPIIYGQILESVPGARDVLGETLQGNKFKSIFF